MLFERKVYTVSELTKKIRETLEVNFDLIWVTGEISNLRTPSSGHYYFTLKDKESQIKAVLFRPQLRFLKFLPQDGMDIICYGRLTVYEKRGEYQIIIEYLEPKGIGALSFAFEQLKEKLSKEGLFDQAHKKPIPFLPKRIGIITSPTGAAIRDMIQIIGRRFSNLEIYIYPVRVQGEEAPSEIVKAIYEMNQWGKVDVIILGRGGGSLEDLWAFNTEEVARAIFDSKIPIISAVGHEIDFTIADFVADLRAPTPSAAAELVVREKWELMRLIEQHKSKLLAEFFRNLEKQKERLNLLDAVLKRNTLNIDRSKMRLDELFGKMEKSIRSIIKINHQNLLPLHEKIIHLKPTSLLNQCKTKTNELKKDLIHLMNNKLVDEKNRLANLISILDEINPLSVLKRGYSIVKDPITQRIITNSKELKKGQEVEVNLKEGVFWADVTRIK